MTKEEVKIQIVLGLYNKYRVYGYRSFIATRGRIVVNSIVVWALCKLDVDEFIQHNMNVLTQGVYTVNNYEVEQDKGIIEYNEGDRIILKGGILNENS